MFRGKNQVGHKVQLLSQATDYLKRNKNTKALSLKSQLHLNETKRLNHVFYVKSVVAFSFWTEVNLWNAQAKKSYIGKFVNKYFSKQKLKIFLIGPSIIN